MKSNIHPQHLTIAGKRMVVLGIEEFERLTHKADEWEPELPAPNERGNYPLEAADVVFAQKLLRRRRAMGWTQADLARRAKVRLQTLDRIEHGEYVPSERVIYKIERTLQLAEASNNGKKLRLSK